MYLFRFRIRVRRRRRRQTRAEQTNYRAHKEVARSFVLERLSFWNAYYGFSIGRVSIKNQRTCWGSCSAKGNLNFNYKIAALPPYLADYVIVHELCHLGELNHSARFWDLVGKSIPDYAKRRAALKKLPIHLV